jgi:hypothetical protein
VYATVKREAEHGDRDKRLLAGQYPGNTDGRYRAACTHAERWGLPVPLAVG